MKVILDFPNLEETPKNSKCLQRMADSAKLAKGFLFFIDYGDNAGIQVVNLNIVTLAEFVIQLEDSRPRIKELNDMFRSK